MKNLKLYIIAFVFGTTSVFATSTDLPDVPLKQNSSQNSALFTAPVNNVLFDTTITTNVERADNITYSKNTSLNKKQLVNKNNTDIVQIVNNYDNMNSKNSQIRQIRNYSYIMSDIMKKE